MQISISYNFWSICLIYTIFAPRLKNTVIVYFTNFQLPGLKNNRDKKHLNNLWDLLLLSLNFNLFNLTHLMRHLTLQQRVFIVECFASVRSVCTLQKEFRKNFQFFLHIKALGWWRHNDVIKHPENFTKLYSKCLD